VLTAAECARNAYLGVHGRDVGELSEAYGDVRNDPDFRYYKKIAEMCIARSVRSTDYMLEASAYYIAMNRKPELPQDYVNEMLLNRFCEQNVEIDPEPPEHRWQRYENRLKGVARRYGDGFDVFGWLLSAGGLEAWFRVAWPHGDATLKKYYGASAYNEMVKDPRITRFLRERRPLVVEELQENFGELYGGRS